MDSFQNIVTIARTPDEVFAFLADLRNIPKWNYAIARTVQTSPGCTSCTTRSGGNWSASPGSPPAQTTTPGASCARPSAGSCSSPSCTSLWIAVDAARRGRGHGTTLLSHVLDHLAAAGISVVEAKTLDRSSGYRPYEATRAFWERNGFIHIDTIDPLPGWQPGNPAAIYVAAVRPTR